MSRKHISTVPYLILTSLAGLALMLLGFQATVTSAQSAPSANTDFPVSMQVVGTIKTLSSQELVLADDSDFNITQDTQMPNHLQVGQTVTVVAGFDDQDNLVAQTITLGDTTDSAATPAPTDAATMAATSAVHGKGEDVGKGNDQNDQNDNQNG